MGSGKTTAIQHAAQFLQKQGSRVGVITNDQGTQQVDTHFIRNSQIPSAEVANGCFCCRYEDLEKSIASLMETAQPEVVFAESVGSCTDLAATVINPLLRFHPGEYDVVLSVFADIRLLIAFLQNNKRIFFDNVNYIYQKQLEEADIIVVNKTDLLTAEQLAAARLLIDKAYTGKKILYQNSLKEEGIKNWLQVAAVGMNSLGVRPALDIDYNIYGAGEAEMAWLDEELEIITADGSSAAAACFLMNTVYDKMICRGYVTGHLKFFLDDGQFQHKISFTTLSGRCNGYTGFSNSNRVTLLVNARVQADPKLLTLVMKDAIAETEQLADCTIVENKLSFFKPGFPKPTHRMVG